MQVACVVTQRAAGSGQSHKPILSPLGILLERPVAPSGHDNHGGTRATW